MAKRPARPVPRERHMGEGGWPPADRTPQGIGQMIDRELAVLELRKFLVHRLNRMRLARSERGHQCGPRDIGFGVNEYVHRRKALIVHAPAVVQVVIDRNLDDARGRHAGAEYRFQGSGRSTQSRLKMTSASRIASVACAAMPIVLGEPTCSRWSVGKAAATLRSVATRAPSRSASAMRVFQALRSRDTRPARINGCFASRNRSAARLMGDGGATLSPGGMNRLASIGSTGSASLLSCIPASRLT